MLSILSFIDLQYCDHLRIQMHANPFLQDGYCDITMLKQCLCPMSRIYAATICFDQRFLCFLSQIPIKVQCMMNESTMNYQNILQGKKVIQLKGIRCKQFLFLTILSIQMTNVYIAKDAHKNDDKVYKISMFCFLHIFFIYFFNVILYFKLYTN